MTRVVIKADHVHPGFVIAPLGDDARMQELGLVKEVIPVAHLSMPVTTILFVLADEREYSMSPDDMVFAHI